ncbi:amidohydrolase family protein [Protaetiibacter larvae]|uniref:Amidohydrolase family protein n=1 Tax=Protaetiibacter larvae TaxID=2592654 RepID=A0A5C1Y8L2_9MICO|nr:amidohydrolase family protein [Protaetiibacter larvae]QEO10433.1 amidohydrolase family protein [Protaetiibacter larvae]
MTRTDAHVHVWDLAAAEYPWLGPGLAPLDRDHQLGELLPSLDAARIAGIVLVQAADNDADTAHMLAVADTEPRVVGIVGWLPLDRPDEVARRLDAGLDPRIVGIRALIHDMADGDWILRPEVSRSLALLAEARLSYDVVTAGPAALALVPELARRHPELSLVIDHLGKPPIDADADTLAEWRALLADAAAFPRVAAKLSGLTASIGPADAWTHAQVEGAVDTALELFGVDRVLFGGDWPVSKLAGGYTRTHAAVDAALARLSPAETDAIRGGTAARVYRIPADRLAAARAASDFPA